MKPQARIDRRAGPEGGITYIKAGGQKEDGIFFTIIWRP